MNPQARVRVYSPVESHCQEMADVAIDVQGLTPDEEDDLVARLNALRDYPLPHDSQSEEAADTSVNTDDVCQICLSPPEDRATIDCARHEFCYVCIARYMLGSRVCPTCRARVTFIKTSTAHRTVLAFGQAPEPEEATTTQPERPVSPSMPGLELPFVARAPARLAARRVPRSNDPAARRVPDAAAQQLEIDVDDVDDDENMDPRMPAWMAATHLMRGFAFFSRGQPAQDWVFAFMWLFICGAPRLFGWLVALYIYDPMGACLVLGLDIVLLVTNRGDRSRRGDARRRLTTMHCALVGTDVMLYCLPLEHRYGDVLRFTRFTCRGLWVLMDSFENYLKDQRREN